MALVIGDIFNNLLLGTSDPDQVIGLAGHDVLVGGGGNDLLDGGPGVDRATYVASFEGVTVDLDGPGLFGTGSGGTAQGDLLIAIENVTGSTFGDVLDGDGQANSIDGLGGDDALGGGGGTDILDGGNGNDRLTGGTGADVLRGGAGLDTAIYATSNAGIAVTLDNALAASGGQATGDTFSGIENVEGSAFADVIRGDGAGNTISGGQGIDVLSGQGGDDALIGDAGADTLLGGNGRDKLVGGVGADTMAGGLGDDTYNVDNAGDAVSEAGATGLDTVQTGLSFSLLSPAVTGDVENVTLTGTANVNATGNALANMLVGNAGNNRLDGGAGIDVMRGGAGNDRYVVNSGGDRVDEDAPGSGGIDQVDSSVTFSLRGAQVGGFQDAVENLQLTGAAAIGGFGNAVANRLVGNGAANSLMGMAGNDALTGGGGADTFMFHAALNAATNVDTITDFDVAQDTMRLENLFMAGLGTGALSAGAFHVGAAAHDSSDRIVYDAANGDLSFDVDGTGAAAAIRFADLDAGLALTSADFFVV